MPRSTSDGGSGTLLRSVLGKSPFQSVSNGEDENATSKQSSSGKDYRNRASKLFSHSRSSSVQFNTEPKDSSFKSRRQKSLSHLERLNPVSSARKVISPTHSFHSDYSAETALSAQYTPEDFLGRVVQHGEVHVNQIGWRKRSEYLVLTENHLLRFKSIKKAVESFPEIIPYGSLLRRTSTSHSNSSLSTMLTNESQAKSGSESPTEHSSTKRTISLQQIITVQTLLQSRTRVTIEIVSYNASSSHVSTAVFQVERLAGQTHWLESLGTLAREIQHATAPPIPGLHWEMLGDIIGMEAHQELGMESLIYPVFCRLSNTGHAGYSMPDSLNREPPILHYIILGKHKVYIVPLSPVSKPGNRAPSSHGRIGAFGFVCLSKVILSEKNDSFDLIFRNPQQPAAHFELVSLDSRTIAQQLHHRLENLLPNWDLSSYVFVVPGISQSRLRFTEPIICSPQDTFGKVLHAYCAAWGLSAKIISYSIQTEGKDTPAFQLLSRTENGGDYSSLELLAVLRALRYNDYFNSISFSRISFDHLATAFDNHGSEHVCLKSSLGPNSPLNYNDLKNASMLYQEFSSMILTGRKLRRLDLTGCIRRKPNANSTDMTDDQGCGLVQPLYRLCINQNTNIDWIILNDIHLSQTDVEYVIGLLSNRDCHLRAIELSNCQLDMWSLRLLLSTFPSQGNTLEVINISNNPGRLSPEVSFDLQLANCQSLRAVDLSSMTRTAEPVSLIPYNIITAWRLEELNLNHTSLNEDTIDTLVEYLDLPTSKPLRSIHLKGCGLNGSSIGCLFRAMSGNKDHGEIHTNVHLDITGNNIEAFDEVAEALREHHGPSSLVWRLLDFQDEEQFGLFLRALQVNQAIRILDLSQLFLDFQMGAETIEILAELMSKNKTLEEINLSANNSRLDDCQLGPQIHQALLGLCHNKTLKILRIADQAIGSEGALALAQVLKCNTSLTEIHCENNNINLASFTLLVDAMQHNHKVTFLSSMECDKSRHVHAIETSIIKAARPQKSAEFIEVNIRPGEKESLPQDVTDAIEEVGVVVDEHWNLQRKRLEHRLERNRQIAGGELQGMALHDDARASFDAQNHKLKDDDQLPSLEAAFNEL